MSHEKHVLLRADDCSQSLAKDRIILYAQDTNRLALNHYGFTASAESQSAPPGLTRSG